MARVVVRKVQTVATMSRFHEGDDPSMTIDQTEMSMLAPTNRIFDLINEDNLDEFKQLLFERPTVKLQQNETGETPLNTASRLGRLEMVNALLADGDEVNAADNEYWTPLLNACYEGHSQIAERLIDNAAEIELPDGILQLGWTPLLWAVYNDHLECLKILLRNQANIHVLDEEDSLSALMMACARGFTDVAMTLIDAGADTNTSDRFGNTPLIWAARKGCAAVTKRLLTLNADVDAVGMAGPLRSLELFLDFSFRTLYSSTPLILATKGNYNEIVDQLLAKNCNVNAVDKNGNTALFIAAREGNADNVNNLLDSGAYVNIRDHDDDPLLMAAVKGSSLNVVKSLLLKFSDVNGVDANGRTALHMALDKNLNDIAITLLDSHPSLEIRNSDGETVLMRAVINRNVMMCELLMHQGAKVSTVDQNGDNCLHHALRSRSKRITQILLSRTHDARFLYRPNKSGQTPYAIDQGFSEPILPSIFGPVESQTQTDAMLGYDVYANVLADIFCEPNMQLPLSVGLYAKWGSGKSFLITKIKESLMAFSRTWLDAADLYWSWTFALVLVLSALTFPLIVELPLVIADYMSPATELILDFGLGILLFLAYGILYYGSEVKMWPSFMPLSMHVGHVQFRLSLIGKMLFFRPPTFVEKDLLSSPVSFLFADYHRLSSIGGEQALAKIVLNLYEQVETHYGWIACRLYCAIKPHYARGNQSQLRRVCGVPVVLIALCVVVLFIIGCNVLLFSLSAEPFKADSSSFASSVAILIICLLIALYPLGLVIYNILTCPLKRRIGRATRELSTLKFEGFMNRMHQEIGLLTDLIGCINAFTISRTRMVVVVDGLDNCEHDRMLQTLDAMDLLFCARQSRPFIVLVAVDPHIIITAINHNLNHSLTGTELTGNDYLKNIINMPFYLHSGGFRQLQANLTKRQDTVQKWKQRFTRQDTHHASFVSLADTADARKSRMSRSVYQSNQNLSQMGPVGTASISNTIVQDDYFSNINPRSMKRIINGLNLTGRLMRAFEIDFSWFQLAEWISLIEQWPYRSSALIEACDDNSLCPDDMQLLTVYDKIKDRLVPPRHQGTPVVDSVSDIDRNAQNFELHLHGARAEQVLNVSHLRLFAPCTSNLDPYVRKLIRERRLDRNEPQLPGLNPIPHAGGELMLTDTDGTLQIANNALALFKSPDILLSLQKPLCKLSCSEVVRLVQQLDIPKERAGQYSTRITQNNLNGFVLMRCDLDELKTTLRMALGDWVLFQEMLDFIKEGHHIGLTEENFGIVQTRETLNEACDKLSIVDAVIAEQELQEPMTIMSEVSPRSEDSASVHNSRQASIRRRRPNSGQSAKSQSVTPTSTDADNHQRWLLDNFARMDDLEFDGDQQLGNTQTTSSTIPQQQSSVKSIYGSAKTSRASSLMRMDLQEVDEEADEELTLNLDCLAKSSPSSLLNGMNNVGNSAHDLNKVPNGPAVTSQVVMHRELSVASSNGDEQETQNTIGKRPPNDTKPKVQQLFEAKPNPE